MNIIELYENRIHLEKKLEKRTAQLRESQKKLEKNNEFLINALSSVVEFRSLESGERIKRVETFTGILLYHLLKMYPDMLSGEDIPIWAQIVSIVDVYDALVSKRVYKIPYAVEEAERMILAGECGVFSPKIIDCFEAAKLELFQLTEGKFKFLEE